METMYDLMYLAFGRIRRVITYMLGAMNGSTSNQFSKALGLGTQHELAHGAGKPGGFIRQGKWNVCLAENLARFLQKMAGTPEGDGTLLDNTMVLMGTSNSRTHNNHNYPLIFAGGNNMGFKHNGTLLRKEWRRHAYVRSLFTVNRMGISDTAFSGWRGRFVRAVRLRPSR